MSTKSLFFIIATVVWVGLACAGPQPTDEQQAASSSSEAEVVSAEAPASAGQFVVSGELTDRRKDTRCLSSRMEPSWLPEVAAVGAVSAYLA